MLAGDRRDALRAALLRVDPHMSETERETELSWLETEVPLTADGSIFWKSFPLGVRLFICLGESQNWRCCYCGAHTNGSEERYATLEHFLAKSLGGRDHPDNMVMSCNVCNNEGF